jgi:hypothetical protein
VPYKFSTSIGGFDFVTNGTSNISKVVFQELQKQKKFQLFLVNDSL